MKRLVLFSCLAANVLFSMENKLTNSPALYSSATSTNQAIPTPENEEKEFKVSRNLMWGMFGAFVTIPLWYFLFHKPLGNKVSLLQDGVNGLGIRVDLLKSEVASLESRLPKRLLAYSARDLIDDPQHHL